MAAAYRILPQEDKGKEKEPQPARVKTCYYPKFFEAKEAKELYQFLERKVPWIDGVPSKREGFTRKAYPLDLNKDDEISIRVSVVISLVMEHLKMSNTHQVLGVYLNWYQNGTHWTPAHRHPKQTQIIISLGATRTLNVGKKNYALGSGDVIVFGSSTHGIPKEPQIQDGRISIALFTIPTPQKELEMEQDVMDMLNELGII